VTRLAGVLVAGVLAAALAAPVLAAGRPTVAPATGTGYADSVDRALAILRSAAADDRAAARQAAGVLEAGTGQSQPEILADLRAQPPDVPDARARLTVLARADRSPAFVPEPGRASRAIDDILAQPRYARLRQGPSPWDRFLDALGRLLLWVLDRAGGVPAGVGLALVAAAVLVLAGVVIAVARSARWAGPQEWRPGEAALAEGAARDRFAQADRLAAAGDLDGAVRELAGGVAAALGDDRAWEVSPLTVRELFARATDAAALRPLLLTFEAAVYGDRPPAPSAYLRAAEAAAPFRARPRAAA
jgi:hypothetical protein